MSRMRKKLLNMKKGNMLKKYQSSEKSSSTRKEKLLKKCPEKSLKLTITQSKTSNSTTRK